MTKVKLEDRIRAVWQRALKRMDGKSEGQRRMIYAHAQRAVAKLRKGA